MEKARQSNRRSFLVGSGAIALLEAAAFPRGVRAQGWPARPIDEYVPRSTCPMLAIQGEEDQYGTMEQIDRITRVIPGVEVLKLKNCRHSPHRDQPAAVIERVTHYVRQHHL